MEGVYEFSPRNSHSRPSPRYDLGILSQSNAPSRPRPHTQPHATQLVHRAATPTHDVGCSAPRTSTPSSGDCPFPNPAPVLPRWAPIPSPDSQDLNSVAASQEMSSYVCLLGRATFLDANLLHAHFQDCLDAYLSLYCRVLFNWWQDQVEMMHIWKTYSLQLYILVPISCSSNIILCE